MALRALRALRSNRRHQAIDQRALAGSWRAGDANQIGASRMAEDRADQVATRGIFVLDERNRARHCPRIARQDAFGERHRDKSCRAMTSRWISLVPSPMVVRSEEHTSELQSL